MYFLGLFLFGTLYLIRVVLRLEYKTGGPPVAALMMSLSALKTELAGLNLEIGHEIDREIHEGPLHDGMSAVVQVLGRKP